MMKRFLAALALVSAAGAARADAPPKAAPAKAVTVPFELLRSGHMAVQVKVNGKGPYRLIFDTGAPITLINNKVAREAGLLKNADRPLFSLFGAMAEVKVRELQVGDQKAADVSAMVMDHPTVEAIARAFGPIEGIVGFPFFARFKLTLDYQAKTLTFVPNGFKPPDVMKAMVAALTTGTLGADAAPKVLSPAAQWGMLVRKDADDEADGVPVTEVLPGGAAAAAGLKAGDRLLTLDGRWTDTLADLYTAAGYAAPGKEVAVVVKRGGKDVGLKVKPASGL
jgi:membrane-associated protease RseP (regulator of RpoE activity)